MVAVPAGDWFGSINPPKNTRGYQEMCGGGFGYGESEYEVSFGLATRNGELSPSNPKTPEHFNSSFRAESEVRFELTAKFGVGRSKLGVPEHIYPEIKGRWLN